MADRIIWGVSPFDGLDIYTLYNILRLRSQTFVVEQGGIYQDLDEKDFVAIHLQGYLDKKLVAYCRIFKEGDYFTEASIGRVIVSSDFRKEGYGHLLMDKAIEITSKLLLGTSILISAQAHLQSFYEVHGFERVSDEYIEDGIPHIKMKKNVK